MKEKKDIKNIRFSERLHMLEEIHHHIQNVKEKDLETITELYEKAMVLFRLLEKDIRSYELRVQEVEKENEEDFTNEPIFPTTKNNEIPHETTNETTHETTHETSDDASHLLQDENDPSPPPEKKDTLSDTSDEIFDDDPYLF